MIIKVITLAVVPIKESITIRETLPMHIVCHCAVLGYVYSDLKIYWTIDNNIWKDYGITLPVLVNIDYIPIVNKSHHGTWRCIVEQADLNFKWTTNIIRVKGKRSLFIAGHSLSHSHSFTRKTAHSRKNEKQDFESNINVTIDKGRKT